MEAMLLDSILCPSIHVSYSIKVPTTTLSLGKGLVYILLATLLADMLLAGNCARKPRRSGFSLCTVQINRAIADHLYTATEDLVYTLKESFAKTP